MGPGFFARTHTLGALLTAAILALLSISVDAQSTATVIVQANPQTKVYGAPDPAFTYTYGGFTSGDTASSLSGQPSLSAPQRVQNLWQYTESVPTTLWQFSTDGATQQSNGIRLSHVTSGPLFYSSISSSITSLPAPAIVPGMRYLLSFYALSGSASSQLYWHRYLHDGSATGWGPTAIGPTPTRVVFQCAGTASGALDCGNDPAIPIGSGPDQSQIYWLFLGNNNALGGDPSVPGFQELVPADLYIGGFQLEAALTEKRGVLAMGDSLTVYDCFTNDTLACTSWSAFAASQLDVPFYNRGIAGETCDQVMARWSTDASPILAANAKYAIIFCGTNDISFQHPAAQIEQTLAAMSDLAIADGAIPVMTTIPPYVTPVSTAESTRQTLNAWIRATYPSVLDFDRVIADPGNLTQQNPAYVGDGTHLNFAGRAAEGAYVAQSVLSNTSGYPQIWDFHAPTPYQPVLGKNPSNGMDFHPGAQREVGTYIILPAAGTLASPKYQFAVSSALLTVSPAPLSVTANDKSITYGAQIPTLDGTFTGALAADNLTATYSTTATDSSVPGAYAISATLADPDNRLPNYAVTRTVGTLTIVPTICAAPTFTVASGSYTSPPTISIVDTTPGAAIHYTVDGSAPTLASPLYTGPITIQYSETIQAVAAALPGYTTSPVAQAAYTVIPVISALSPAYTSAGVSALTVTIDGSGFTPASVAYLGGAPIATQFVSSMRLTAQVPATALIAAGVASVTVRNNDLSSSAFQFETDSSVSAAYAPAFSPTASVTAGSSAALPVILPATVSNAAVTCLNLPANATCDWSQRANTLTISTASTTPSGSYQVVITFTETVPFATSAWVMFPFLFLPLARSRKRARLLSLTGMLLVLALVAAMNGCGGQTSSVPPPPSTQQVTSSGVVVLTVH